MKAVRVAIGLAITAALVRLIPLHFLHPLNWDELESFRAAAWIAEGRVPFRDFWQHHTPLVWFLFAPFTMTESTGTGAVIVLRWAQVPVWIATFALMNVWMRDLGLDRFARWAAMALALSSSLFMLPALEFRLEAVACAFLAAGLVLLQRGHWFLAGAAFCLVGMANLRFGPFVVVLVLLLLATRDDRWRLNLPVTRIFAGGLAMLGLCLLYFLATDSLDELYGQVWVDNQAEKYYKHVGTRFVHRLLVPFGVRLLATDRFFELAAFDVGGAALLILGAIGIAVALRRWRNPDRLFVLAAASLVNLLFLVRMKFIYNYHFSLVVIGALPLIASLLERIGRRRAVVALLIVAWTVNGFASLFRGKELDLAYQDLIMREMHARTPEGETIFSGAAWPTRREPAYRYWFLPRLIAPLVLEMGAPRYSLAEVIDHPPATVIFDHNTYLWWNVVQPELVPHFVRHYIPLWRELWIPAMNARIPAGGQFTWRVPRDGAYRVYVSRELAQHPWFHAPIRAAKYKERDAARLTITLPAAGAGPVQFDRDVTHLRKGDRLSAFNPANEDLAVILLPTDDRILFRQPAPGVTLEGETTRITHVPNFRP